MSWKAVEEILYIDEPIRQGVDWGGSQGFEMVSDTVITSYTFELALKHGDQTIVTLTEANGYLTKSGSYTLYMKIPRTQTSIIKKGLVLQGNLVGVASGVSTFFGTINVQTR